VLPFQQTLADETAFRDGHADRQAWEAWFNGLSGVFRAGAEFWASHRSGPSPPDCASTSDVAFRTGCEEAKKRLDESDRRRHTEADYKAGWNSPLDAATGATAPAMPAQASTPPPNNTEAVPAPEERQEAISVAQRDVETYYCHPAAASTLHPFYVIVDFAHNTMVWELQYTTASGGGKCTARFHDGTYGPTWVGNNAEFCALNTDGDNDNINQSVTISPNRILVKTYGGNRRFSLSLDLRTGRLESTAGLEAQCQRAHI
jgi:hypothetical protein